MFINLFPIKMSRRGRYRKFAKDYVPEPWYTDDEDSNITKHNVDDVGPGAGAVPEVPPNRGGEHSDPEQVPEFPPNHGGEDSDPEEVPEIPPNPEHSDPGDPADVVQGAELQVPVDVPNPEDPVAVVRGAELQVPVDIPNPGDPVHVAVVRGAELQVPVDVTNEDDEDEGKFHFFSRKNLFFKCKFHFFF